MENEFFGEEVKICNEIRDFLKKNRRNDGLPNAFISFDGSLELAVLEVPTYLALVGLAIGQWYSCDDLDGRLRSHLAEYFDKDEEEIEGIYDAFQRFRIAHNLFTDEELKMKSQEPQRVESPTVKGKDNVQGIVTDV